VIWVADYSLTLADLDVAVGRLLAAGAPDGCSNVPALSSRPKCGNNAADTIVGLDEPLAPYGGQSRIRGLLERSELPTDAVPSLVPAVRAVMEQMVRDECRHFELVAAECLRLHAEAPGSDGVQLITVEASHPLEPVWDFATNSVYVSYPARGIACVWPREGQ
jgi:hypothetical protein